MLKKLFILVSFVLSAQSVFANSSSHVSLNKVVLSVNPFLKKASSAELAAVPEYAFVVKLGQPMDVTDEEYGQTGLVHGMTLRLTAEQFATAYKSFVENKTVDISGSVRMPESSIEVVGHAVLVVDQIK